MTKTPLEKLKLERRQLRRAFTKTFNEVATLFDESLLSDKDVSQLKSAADALNVQFRECQDLDRELRSVVLEDMEDEDDMDTFFDEVNEVTTLNRGKISELEFYLSKFEKKSTPSPSAPPLLSTPTLRSKLPDLQLPDFDGKITEWFGFWERFQSQVGSLSDLPNSSKFTYLIGQLRGEALKTVKGILPSEQNYYILVETLQENFGHPRRIIRAHVNDILTMPLPTQSASSLRQFYNSLLGDICSLKLLVSTYLLVPPLSFQ